MGIERIQTYNMGFYICLGITVLGVVLAVTFFFTLHIKDAWKMSSGRARSESIRNIKVETNQEKSTVKRKVQEKEPGWKQTEVLRRAGEMREQVPIRNGTMVLNPQVQSQEEPTENIYFSITKNIMLIHTDEKI